MKYDLVIWDFNGTICDDVQIGIDCINVVLERRSMHLVDSKEYYRECFCFPIIDYYAKLGFDFEKEPYSIPADEWTFEYLKRENEITENEGATITISKIKEAGISQIVLSSSEITMLERELDILGLKDSFDAVLGLDNTYAGGKIALAKKWSEGKNYNAVFIGDSVHDYDTAKAIGADCILFTGGHDSREHIESCPCPSVDSLPEILPYIL